MEVGSNDQASEFDGWVDVKPDLLTLEAYNAASEFYAQRWDQQPEAVELHRLIRTHFVQGITADVGCGSGRETAWLAANGYPAIGYDASVGLLEECRKRHPGLRFEHLVLPELLGVEPATFDNVLCETVLMHLPLAAIPFAASRLSSILRIGGVCYLSWRVTTGQGARDARGRLYTSFPADVVTTNLERIEVLDEFERTSDSSGELVHVVVGRKSA